MLFDARTEQRKQDMRDMNQTFVLVRIWNESLSGSELCWCLKCFSSVLDIDVWRVFLRQRIGGAKQRSKKSKRRQENWGEMWKNDITSKRQDFGKFKTVETYRTIWSLGTLPYSLSWQATLLANGEPWRFQDWAFWDSYDLKTGSTQWLANWCNA